MPTPFINHAGPAAEIELKVLGLSDDFFTNNDHNLQIKLNEEEIVKEKYEGYAVEKFSIDRFPLNKLRDTTDNVFELNAMGFYASIDQNALSYISINYPRTFNFEGFDQFAFTLTSNTVTSDLIEIENFEHDENSQILLDITNGFRMEGIIEDSKSSFHIPASKDRERLLFVYQNNANTIHQIKQLTKTKFTDYTETAKQGNYLMVSNTQLMKEGYVDDYATYRSNETGGNYKPLVVNVEQLYDQFAYGIQKHPLAIKNFMDFAIDQWQVKPEYLLLIGKSIKNSLCRYDTLNWKNNLVPTYGEAPSDWQFGKYEKSAIPEIAVGRISASQPEDILNYLNKVKQYENDDIDYCNAEALSWRKEVLQFNGCPNGKIARIIKDTLYGGNLTCFKYISHSCYDTLLQNQLYDLLNQKRFGIINNFYLLNSDQNWKFDIGEAKEYKDEARYPFILSLTPFTGDVHQSHSSIFSKPSMSEEWVLEKDAGAIAYLGAINYGFPPSLFEYGENMYQQLAYKNYNQPIGKSMLNVIQNIYRDNGGIQISLEEMNLQGDPAIIINYMPKPEFEIIKSQIVFEPDTIIDPLDSIKICLPLINAGTYNLSDSVQLCIERKNINGDVMNSFTEKLLIPNKTLFTTTLFANGQAIQASDSYTFHIDCNNAVEENCEENNLVESSLFMVSIEEDTFSPYEFGFLDFPITYPNPATKQVNCSVESTRTQLLHIAWYNINGSLIKHQNRQIQKGANQFSFDVENWDSGTYVMKITASNHILYRKMIKH